ncbi:MAG TPA: hypothetical protein VHT94_02580 [Streptosporangiaceae bacterium]|nr:hypothetical protein [Streptosporangiaceae bacterium]
MRFLRHLAAVLLVVAAVVLLALAWNHVEGGTQGAVRQGRDERVAVAGPHGGPATAVHGIRPGHGRGPVIIDLRPMDLGLTSMFDPVNLPSLRHAVVIEAEVAAAVVVIDVIRRRWRRRARREDS